MNNLSDKQRNILIASGAAVALLIVGVVLAPEAMAAIVAFLFIAVVVIGIVAAWLAPVWIAVKRDHPSKGGIIALNILLGWTFVGWVVAFVWALSNNQSGATTVVVNNGTGGVQTAAAVTTPSYEVGDVMNGHRFNGETWVPIAQISANAETNNS